MKYVDFAQVKTRAATGQPPSIIITTPRVDWDRDRAIPDWLRIAPEVAVLFAHDYSDLPVGRSVSTVLNPDGSRRAWFRWLQNDERAARVKNAFEQDMLSASIGVRTDRVEPNEFGGQDFGGAIIEFSLCSIPANEDCVRQLKSLGIWKREAVRNGPRNVEVSMSAVEQGYDEMDKIHRVLQAASDAWDEISPRNVAGMGAVIAKPDFRSLDAGFVPKECRGFGALTPEQQRQHEAVSRHAHGLPPLAGPARAHGVNLGASPLIEFDRRDLDAMLNKIRLTLLERIAKQGPAIDTAVRAAVNRARGRID